MPLDQLGRRAFVPGLPASDELQIPLFITRPAPPTTARCVAHSIQPVDVTAGEPLRSFGARGSVVLSHYIARGGATQYTSHWRWYTWSESDTGVPSGNILRTLSAPSRPPLNGAPMPSSW